MDKTRLEAIHCFPIKGLPAISLTNTDLVIGRGIPNDRRYAITNGTMSDGKWMPAGNYFVNAYNDGLLNFKVTNDEQTSSISISNPENQEIRIQTNNPQSLELANLTLERFISHIKVKADRTPPQIVELSDAGGSWDYPGTEISLINQMTVKAIGDAMDRDLDPERFRGNLILSGLNAWQEFDLLGKKLGIGDAEIEVLFPIVRCPAPGVNPKTGLRDIDFEQEFPTCFGHAYCGMYARVTKTGKINAEDKIEVLGNASTPLARVQELADPYPLWPRFADVGSYDVNGETTQIALNCSSPWPFPDAKPGQRLRFHLNSTTKATGWTSAYLDGVSNGQYHLSIPKSETGDPLTEYLRTELGAETRLLISGPFGRV
ncbi:MAG: MOSC domain-containing protein [Pseudomonadota bacterium]